jgi:3-dehydro-L-gulonate 2-dehydrogenase
MRIPYAELCEVLQRVLVRIGFEHTPELCSRLFADASLDGVYSHGLNRFPRFIETIKTE